MLQREAFYVTNTKPITWKICKSVVGSLTITKYRSIQDIIPQNAEHFCSKTWLKALNYTKKISFLLSTFDSKAPVLDVDIKVTQIIDFSLSYYFFLFS